MGFAEFEAVGTHGVSAFFWCARAVTPTAVLVQERPQEPIVLRRKLHSHGTP